MRREVWSAVLFADAGELLCATAGRIPHDVGVAATVGFLGAYTTFATFAWEVFTLIRSHRTSTAAAYVAASVVLAVAAAGAGHLLARTVPGS